MDVEDYIINNVLSLEPVQWRISCGGDAIWTRREVAKMLQLAYEKENFNPPWNRLLDVADYYIGKLVKDGLVVKNPPDARFVAKPLENYYAFVDVQTIATRALEKESCQ